MNKADILKCINGTEAALAKVQAKLNELKEMLPQDNIYSIADVARAAGMNKQRVRDRLPPPTHLVGRRHYYVESEIEGLLEILNRPRRYSTPEGYMSVAAACDYMGFSVTAWRYRAKRGDIPRPSHTVNGRVYYKNEEVEAIKSWWDAQPKVSPRGRRKKSA